MNKMLLVCILSSVFALCSCKKGHDEVRPWVFVPEKFDPCTDEERAELTRKATNEYPFELLKTIEKVGNPRFCKRMKAYINAIDALPPIIKEEFERLVARWKLKIYVADDSVEEFGPTDESMAGGIYNWVGKYIVVRLDSRNYTLWHEIGHFFDHEIVNYHFGYEWVLSDTREFRKAYHEIKCGCDYFYENNQEGFAVAFEHYVGLKVMNNDNCYQPLFEFFDQVFSNPDGTPDLLHERAHGLTLREYESKLLGYKIK